MTESSGDQNVPGWMGTTELPQGILCPEPRIFELPAFPCVELMMGNLAHVNHLQ